MQSLKWGGRAALSGHPTHTNTFVGTGMARDASTQRPRYLWFGFESDTPNTPTVTVNDNVGAITGRSRQPTPTWTA